MRCNDNLIVAKGHSYSCYLIALIKTDCNKTVLSYISVGSQRSSLYLAVLCYHDDILALVKIGSFYHCGYLLALAQFKKIYYICAS